MCLIDLLFEVRIDFATCPDQLEARARELACSPQEVVRRAVSLMRACSEFESARTRIHAAGQHLADLALTEGETIRYVIEPDIVDIISIRPGEPEILLATLRDGWLTQPLDLE